MIVWYIWCAILLIFMAKIESHRTKMNQTECKLNCPPWYRDMPNSCAYDENGAKNPFSIVLKSAAVGLPGNYRKVKISDFATLEPMPDTCSCLDPYNAVVDMRSVLLSVSDAEVQILVYLSSCSFFRYRYFQKYPDIIRHEQLHVDFYILCNVYVLQQITKDWYIPAGELNTLNQYDARNVSLSHKNKQIVVSNNNETNTITTSFKATGNIHNQIKSMIKNKCHGRAAGQIDVDGFHGKYPESDKKWRRFLHNKKQTLEGLEELFTFNKHKKQY